MKKSILIIGCPILILGTIALSCSKSDSGGKSTPVASATQTSKAAKSVSALSALNSISTSGAGSGMVNRHLSIAYRQYQLDTRRLQTDTTGLGEALCNAFSMCATEGATDVASDGVGMSCNVSCRGENKNPLYSCTLDSKFETECESGVTYAAEAGGKLLSGTACEKTSEGNFNVSIDGAYDFSISSSDGELDKTRFRCSWIVGVEMGKSNKFEDNLGDEAETLISDCSKFRCTIDGAAIDCAAMKEALAEEDNACKPS